MEDKAWRFGFLESAIRDLIEEESKIGLHQFEETMGVTYELFDHFASTR